MYSTRLVQILMVALSILIATRASWFHHDVGARQLSVDLGDDNDDSSQAEESSSAAATPSDTPTPTMSETPTEVSTTSEPPTSSSNPPSSSENTPTPTPTDDPSSTSSESSPPTSSSSNPITTPPTPKPTNSVSSSTSNDDQSSNTETSDNPKSTTAPPVTLTKTILYTTTDSSGQTHVGSSEAVVVSTPGFSDSDGSKGNSNGGVTPMQKSIIIGVTVGVGGAIILAAGGILYWRLRNKKRNQEENEELISYGAGFGGPGTAEKSEASGPSTSARSPFQSTLENYHAPTQTNAASNF